jgi:hypothetical protein
VREATVSADALGIGELPAVRVGDELVCGPDAPERAAAL